MRKLIENKYRFKSRELNGIRNYELRVQWVRPREILKVDPLVKISWEKKYGFLRIGDLTYIVRYVALYGKIIMYDLLKHVDRSSLLT